MLTISLLGSPTSWYVNDLRRAAGVSHSIRCLDYCDLTAAVAGELSTTRFGDALLLRSMPPGSLEQIVFRMDLLAQAEASGVYVLNPPRAMEVAIDKYLASCRLAAAGIPTPPTHVSQTWQSALSGFAELGGDVVLKPLFGGEGRGITRLSDPDLAERAFKMLEQMGAVIYQQRFIEHEGSDIRILLLGENAWAMRRRNTGDWRTNVSRGATTEPVDISESLRSVAIQAAKAVGAEFAGVDILEGRDGNRYVLEVNAVPGWRALSQTLNVDIAAAVLEHIQAKLVAR